MRSGLLEVHLGFPVLALSLLQREIPERSQLSLQSHHVSSFLPNRMSQLELAEDEKDLVIYRVIQESLTNALKHAKTEEISVNLIMRDRLLFLTIEDNGVGFDYDSVSKNKAIIDRAFSEELGFKITCTLETAKTKAPLKKDLKETIVGDPAIKEVMELFNGKIVDIKNTTEKK